jgi:hypothetical protein
MELHYMLLPWSYVLALLYMDSYMQDKTPPGGGMAGRAAASQPRTGCCRECRTLYFRKLQVGLQRCLLHV